MSLSYIICGVLHSSIDSLCFIWYNAPMKRMSKQEEEYWEMRWGVWIENIKEGVSIVASFIILISFYVGVLLFAKYVLN